MDKPDTYNTLCSKTEGLFKDKGSKFIAYAYPVKNEDEIKALIAEIKKEHHSARHHCYAYRLGPYGENYRTNDDGEPSGTAGKPIFGQLLSFDVTDTLIVVVRYFGGTLLGVSGLINAYKKAAADALGNAAIEQRIMLNYFEIEFDYPMQNNVTRIIKEHGLNIESARYEMNCKLTVSARKSIFDEIVEVFSKTEGLMFDRKD